MESSSLVKLLLLDLPILRCSWSSPRLRWRSKPGRRCAGERRLAGSCCWRRRRGSQSGLVLAAGGWGRGCWLESGCGCGCFSHGRVSTHCSSQLGRWIIPRPLSSSSVEHTDRLRGYILR